MGVDRTLPDLRYQLLEGLLGAAVETRSLARTLWEFRDEADLPR